MITVNLLLESPRNRAAVLSGPVKIVAKLIAAFLLAVLSLTAWYRSVSTQVAQQTAQIQELQRESLQLRVAQLELQRYQREKTELEGRLAVIQELRSERQGPVRLLNSVVSSIPDDPTLWLANLSQRGNDLSIEGEALDAKSIADFVQALEKTPAFNALELDYWEQQPGSLKFKLSGQQAP